MQKRHLLRQQYFREQEATAHRYYLPYVADQLPISRHTRVLEIGCGEGGNLLPFAQLGCPVTGVDIAACRIEEATAYFQQAGYPATWRCADFMALEAPTEPAARFDLILLHDVLEHIHDKAAFLRQVRRFLRPSGRVFVGFPAWQMPFGGHQQIGHHFLSAHLPFIHLLPAPLYNGLLSLCGERKATRRELLDIQQCRLSIEAFEALLPPAGLQVCRRTLWLINPHYQQKFGLNPHRLPRWLERLPHLRNYAATSCWYLLGPDGTVPDTPGCHSR